MSNRIQRALGFAFLAFVPCAALALPVAEELLKSGDHESLGKQLAAFTEAKQANKGIDKATAGVADELDRIKKKLKGRDPLSLTADLGRSLWQSFGYDAKGIKKGKVAAFSVPVPFYGEGAKLEYAVYTPAKYNHKQSYPLILCIPEKGVKPEAHITEKWIANVVRDGAILAACPMPDDPAMWTETGGANKPGGVGNLLTVLKEITRAYALDYDRIYLAGRGEGVAAALTIASRYPDRFAGVIGRSGDAGETACDNFKNLPTFFAGAGSGATAFADKVEKAGYNNCVIKPEGTEDEIWAWIQDHPRASNPPSIVLVPGAPLPNKAYWLEVPPFDSSGTAFVKATIDRATNSIVIDGEGVESVILYFNDALVDLDKPIKITCNGAEHIDQIPRNLQTMLDLMYNSRSDPGKIYVATKPYDLPVKPKPK
jgi:pimeloyl-ACP methyl ester carboxylesterase